MSARAVQALRAIPSGILEACSPLGIHGCTPMMRRLGQLCTHNVNKDASYFDHVVRGANLDIEPGSILQESLVASKVS